MDLIKEIERNSRSVPLLELDNSFIPAVLWNKEYSRRAQKDAGQRLISISISRAGGKSLYGFNKILLPDNADNFEATYKYVERYCKFILWQVGGNRIRIFGADEITKELQLAYSKNGNRSFDNYFIGSKVYGGAIHFESLKKIETHEDCKERESTFLGRNLEGCRIGFDLGGSDRKVVAMIDGEIVFSEEVRWNPYFESDWNYHYDGIQNSIERARKHLPRLDSIGGSAAGIYVDNEVRAASLFRGISQDDFKNHVRDLFKNIQKRWGVPMEVVNDGEISALAGSMSLNKNLIMGISLGTSQAVGYINHKGQILNWLNELAFAPVDYALDAAIDEWSGDRGCGVQYFSQQAVDRLIDSTNLEMNQDLELPEKLVIVQEAVDNGNDEACKIFETIGVYLGYAIAHYREFYNFENIMILGRVTSGKGGELILTHAKKVLEFEFPSIEKNLSFTVPIDSERRNGQARAAASLPEIE